MPQKKLTSIGLVMLFFFLVINYSAADQKCKSVDIKVKNKFNNGKKGCSIKAVNIFYYDREDRKWRDDNIPDKKINYNSSLTFDRNLEYVGNEAITKMQVCFKYKEDDGDWSDRVCSNVMKLDNKPCVKNKDYKLTVTGKSRCRK